MHFLVGLVIGLPIGAALAVVWVWLGGIASLERRQELEGEELPYPESEPPFGQPR